MARQTMSFDKAFSYLDSEGNIDANGNYYKGPWNTKEEAWNAITEGATECTWVNRGFEVEVFDGTTGIKKYQIIKEMPGAGYTIDDLEEVKSGGEIFSPSASDDAKVDLQSLTAAQLKGKTTAQVLDALLFPEYSASGGTAPVLQIVNDGGTVEVGKAINNCSFSVKTSQKDCQYINDSDVYKKFSFTYSAGTVTTSFVPTSSSGKAIFGTVTRNTASATYTRTGPDASKLASGQYLYGSKGTVSTTTPAIIGEHTETVGSTSSTWYGYYCGGINSSKSTLFKELYDYTLSYDGSAFGTSATVPISTDTEATADHTLSTIGSRSVQVYDKSKFTFALTGLIYDSGSKGWVTNKTLTETLNAITPTYSTATFKDANNVDYTVDSVVYDFSSASIYGKFKISVTVTKA